MNTRINGTNVILVPYQEKHVVKFVSLYYTTFFPSLYILYVRINFVDDFMRNLLHLGITNG